VFQEEITQIRPIHGRFVLKRSCYRLALIVIFAFSLGVISGYISAGFYLRHELKKSYESLLEEVNKAPVLMNI
jgi:hypothetical protein